MSMCGGNARCSTCRVRGDRRRRPLPAAESVEQRTLERIHAPDNVRLACQLRPRGDVAVVPLLERR
jgi:adenylate cyclase